MRLPGFEPGSPRWQRDILTTVLQARLAILVVYFTNLDLCFTTSA